MAEGTYQPNGGRGAGPEGPFRAPEVDFPAYLEAKFELDSASLNPRLYAQFCRRLTRSESPRVLDVGTGSGAMLRRILGLELKGKVRLLGLDRDRACLDLAARRLQQLLRRQGLHPRASSEAGGCRLLRAGRGSLQLELRLLPADILDPGLPELLRQETFHCISAQAFMDLMPLAPCLERLRRLLTPGGWFYATLNYDGETTFLPAYRNQVFERRLLEIYNRSMETRRSGGCRTGGSRSGRRLYQALQQRGFRILGLGSSDWNLLPGEGGYGRNEKLFLRSILSMVAREAQAAAWPGQREIGNWFADRLAQVEAGALALVVHQLDLLAEL